MFSVIMEEESLNFRAILWASGRNTVKKKKSSVKLFMCSLYHASFTKKLRMWPL